MRNKDLTSITFYVTPAELEQFRAIATEYEVSLSAVIRSLLKLPRLEPYKHKTARRQRKVEPPKQTSGSKTVKQKTAVRKSKVKL